MVLRILALIILTVSSVAAQQNPGGGSGTGSGGAPAQVVYLSPNCPASNAGNCFNAKFDVTATFDASTTNGTNVVTCPNSDCKFQTGVNPAKAGMIFFANDNTSASPFANSCLDNPDILFGGLRQTTIASVDSDTQIHVVGNSGTTSTAHVCAAWGDDDTTAINAAWTAGGCYSTQQLPNGIAFISAPIWQFAALPASPNCSSFSTTPGPGQAIHGSTVGGTYLMPTPLFNFASITGGGGFTCTPINCTAAVGSPSIFDYSNINVWGHGARCSATLANTALWDIGISTRAVSANGYGWCGRGGGATLTGFNINGGTDIYTWGGAFYFGSVGMNFNGANIFFGNSADFQNNAGTVGNCSLLVQPGSSVISIGNSVTTCVQVGTAGGAAATWSSQTSTYNGNDNGGACFYVGNNSVVNFISNDLVCQTPITNENGTTFLGTGGIERASNSAHFANGTGDIVLGVAGNTFEDTNDNTFTGGAAIWNGLGTWLGSGSAHGTILATGNVVISTCGTSAASAFSGGSTKGQFTITYAGTPGTTCTATVTFPNAFPGAAPICTWTTVGGTNTFPTVTTNGAVSRTSAAVTFSGPTFTNANTDIVQYNCLNP